MRDGRVIVEVQRTDGWMENDGAAAPSMLFRNSLISD
uniref:Uncharacterized protein n=1 Tax=Onchocerca volvulus TaxID=6282 RepID=A0A8R1Y261_ONCVO